MRTLVKPLSWLLLAAMLVAACGPQQTPTLPVATAVEMQTAAIPTPTPVSTQNLAVPTLTPTVPQEPTAVQELTAPAPTSATTLPLLSAGQAVTIASLDMLSAQAGWAIGGLAGESDHILRTGDGGRTWLDVTPPQTPPDKASRLHAVGHFLDLANAWVLYLYDDGRPLQPALVWHTEDGGASWLPSVQLDLRGLEWTFSVSNIQFVDSQHGWLMAHVGVGMNHDYIMLFHTQDGGANWKRIIDPYEDGGIQACYKPGMVFADTQQGWLPVDCNGVMPGALLYHTADGGLTWEMVNLPSPADQPTLFENYAAACGVRDVVFFTPQLGRAGVTCANYETDPLTFLYYLYTTQDGGATWTAAPYPGGLLTFITPLEGWTQNQDIYHTTDGGVSWTKISVVSWEAEFDFVSEMLGWAVAKSGDDSALVRSNDGGVYWSALKPLIAP